MDIEFLITDKRLYNMQQEVFASSELHSSFPRYKTGKDYSNSDTIVIPDLIVPHSKYSSTETELSSLEGNVDAFCREDFTKLTPSEFSISASSTASGRKIQRRRKRKSNGRSSSTLSLNSTGSAASYESRASGLSFLSLNSVRDLEHAIGRHRGVSGSSVPSIDAAIFGMFYMTDVFDTLLLTEPRFSRDGSTSLLEGNIRALLKKEIVYSLRVNYYCPVSKMSKLAQLLEEHSPVDKIKSDIPRFLKILWDILKVPPFLKYSNGSNGYMLPLLVEPRRTNEPNYYQHQQVQTLQYLLNCEFSSELSSSGGPGKLFWGGRTKFLTVPYPALIIEVIRTEDVTLTSHSNNQEPVIPNLELDISAFISRSSLHVADTLSSFHRSCSSITNCSFMSSASFNPERNFLYEYDCADQIPKESRLVKGLKSAWKVMFQYLEDFTTSTHISPDSIVDASVPTIRRNDDDFTQQRTNSEAADWNTNHQPWYLSPPPSHEGRVSRSSSISSSRKSPYRSLTTTSRTPTPTPQAQVWIELIAVICMTNEKETTCDNYLSVNSNHNRKKFSGYSVYCKAGRDKANPKEFAPWVLYQPQRGVAPQVTLIENCGKWISSLESQAENLALYNVPLEIRRMTTESSLFIYRKNDP